MSQFESSKPSPSPQSRPLPHPALYESVRKKGPFASTTAASFNLEDFSHANSTSRASREASPKYNTYRNSTHSPSRAPLNAVFSDLPYVNEATVNSQIHLPSKPQPSPLNLVDETLEIEPNSRKNSISLPQDLTLALFRIQELEKQVKVHQANNDTISKQLSKAQFHINELTNELQDLNSQKSDALSKLKSVTIRCIQAEKSNEGLDAKLRLNEERLSRLELENERLTDENERLNLEASRNSNLTNDSNIDSARPIAPEQENLKRLVQERAQYSKYELERILLETNDFMMKMSSNAKDLKKICSILDNIDINYAEEKEGSEGLEQPTSSQQSTKP